MATTISGKVRVRADGPEHIQVEDAARILHVEDAIGAFLFRYIGNGDRILTVHAMRRDEFFSRYDRLYNGEQVQFEFPISIAYPHSGGSMHGGFVLDLLREGDAITVRHIGTHT